MQHQMELFLSLIGYLAGRLDTAMPVLPQLAERQFIANAADFLVAASMQEYLELVSTVPLEEADAGCR